MEPDFTARMRVGVLGGTFNPLHMGHLILAQSALESFELSKVIFVPCAGPAHKDSVIQASASHRLAMVEIAVGDDLHFEVSDIEIKRGGVSYTIDTIREFQKAYPDAQLFFITGTDTLLELHAWKDIYALLNACTFATFARPGVQLQLMSQESLKLAAPWPERLIQNCRTGRLVDISSSDIRYRIAEGMSIRYLVPRGVEMYIYEHRLYGRRGAG